MDYTYQIVTNLSCNLDCEYCYERKYVSTNDAEAVVDFLTACFERDKDLPKDSGAIIDIIGGEPFLQPKLLVAAFETAERLAEFYGRPYIFSISTNGTLFDRRANRAIIERWHDKISVGLSIDGLQEAHDKYRIYVSTGKGSYDKAVAGYQWLKTQNLRELGLKATFTTETKHLYAAGMKHLIDLSEGKGTVSGNFTYEDIIPRSDAAFFANAQIEILEYWIEKGYYKDPRSILTHLEGSGYGPAAWLPEKRDELKANLTLRNDPERIRPWCGSVKYMTCLGFDRKIYGCNRFMSGIVDRFAIGRLEGQKIILDPQSYLAGEIENQYKDYPESCVSCPAKPSCASCAAAPYEQGNGTADDRKEYHSKKRQCGWTMSKVLVQQWWNARFGSYDSQKDTSVCYCPDCVAKREREAKALAEANEALGGCKGGCGNCSCEPENQPQQEVGQWVPETVTEAPEGSCGTGGCGNCKCGD